MKVVVKIPRVLFDKARVDLRRRHAFASERVGFFSTRCARTAKTLFVYCVEYSSVDDVDYEDDPSVGCRIGPRALRKAMTRADRDSVGQIHVHSHDGTGLPGPSSVDTAELPGVARGLRNANTSGIHGWMILSANDAWTYLLVGKEHAVVEAPVSIVGFPSIFNYRDSLGGDSSVDVVQPVISWWSWIKSFFVPAAGEEILEDRYDRQNFLGERSNEIIGSVTVGVVGLGGGGSHVVQQLAHLGFKKYVIFDDDVITNTNLNRLVGGTVDDVAKRRLKVEIATRTIRALQPDANIVEHASKWEAAVDYILACDVVFGSVDSFMARRDLEGFCRRNLIPYIDVGMDVVKTDKAFEIYGQVFLSMPGCPCMHCFGLLNQKNLAEEAQRYGAAGSRPQVVWSNGVLASTAVGVAVDLITDWSRNLRDAVLLSYLGAWGTVSPDKRLKEMKGFACPHYPLDQAGDPRIKEL
jgi:molybdopterin/thiamine biosynthesis adenylyltransferase